MVQQRRKTVEGLMDELIMEGLVDGWMDGPMNGWTDGGRDGWMDGRMDG